MDITAFANAKINLTLDVLNKRLDGYHDVDTVMQSVSIFDTLYIDITDGEIKVSTNFKTIEDQENLVYKAIVLFYEKANISGGAKCHVVKRIPLLSGLGGGSADAAAAVLALNKYYNEPLDYEQLKDLSILLGADVPFFLMGGTVRAKGIGEDLYALKYVGDYNVLLVKQGNKTSTKTMYGKIDSATSEASFFTDDFVNALEADGDLKNKCGNRFLDVLDDKEDKIKLIEKISSFNADASGLSGAGPTVFGLFKDFALAFNAYSYFKENDYECYLCKTEENAIIIE